MPFSTRRFDPHAGHQLSAAEVRDGRFKLIEDMCHLLLKEVATLPTREQQLMRRAIKDLRDVRTWYVAHSETDTR
jgi:hypothetical protein